MTTHIHHYLARNAANHPNKPAIIDQQRRMTWHELDQAATRVAAQLAPRLSRQEQQVVALLLPNSWQFVAIYMGILRAGHIVLPLDPSFKKLENDTIMDQIKPALAITNEQSSSLLPGALLADDLLTNELVMTAGDFFELPAKVQVATMLFTSGTTGKPKATQYSHANHLWNIAAVSRLWEWTADDTILLSLPLSHWHGLVMALSGGTYHANTIYVHERFDVEQTLHTLTTGAISLFMHVPIAYWKLTQVSKATAATYDLSKVRLCISGSSYLPPAVWHAFKELYGHEILERYGSSETGLVASNPLDDRRPGSVGTPLPGVTVKRQPDGELAMRSPGLFVGYYKNQAATTAKFTSNRMWLTGDIGTFEDDGRLTLRGRIQEKMKKYGYTVFPRDVEWAMLRLASIKDIVVLSIQEEGALNDVIVYFVLGSVSRQDVFDYAKANLPAAWRPDKVILLDEVPKTRSGKPERPKLLALIKAAA